jgi:ankyrin repeat protein
VDQDGSPPIHFAAAFGHKEVVELLIERGARLEAQNAPWNQTPLHLACKKNHEDVSFSDGLRGFLENI